MKKGETVNFGDSLWSMGGKEIDQQCILSLFDRKCSGLIKTELKTKGRQTDGQTDRQTKREPVNKTSDSLIIKITLFLYIP
jgi:hypothetical protein